MEKSDVKKKEEKEEFPRLDASKGGLLNLIKRMQDRNDSNLRRNEIAQNSHRRRGGLGGRGYTKSLHDSVHVKMRRKLAKANQVQKVKKSRRKAKKKRQRLARRK